MIGAFWLCWKLTYRDIGVNDMSETQVTQAETVAVDAVKGDVAAVESKSEGIVGTIEHDAAIAEAYAKGVVHKAEVSVGEVIAALVNRVHALEAHLGMVKAPIVSTPAAPAKAA
jgi:hypothetical protein